MRCEWRTAISLPVDLTPWTVHWGGTAGNHWLGMWRDRDPDRQPEARENVWLPPGVYANEVTWPLAFGMDDHTP